MNLTAVLDRVIQAVWLTAGLAWAGGVLLGWSSGLPLDLAALGGLIAFAVVAGGGAAISRTLATAIAHGEAAPSVATARVDLRLPEVSPDGKSPAAGAVGSSAPSANALRTRIPAAAGRAA